MFQALCFFSQHNPEVFDKILMQLMCIKVPVDSEARFRKYGNLDLGFVQVHLKKGIIWFSVVILISNMYPSSFNFSVNFKMGFTFLSDPRFMMKSTCNPLVIHPSYAFSFLT